MPRQSCAASKAAAFISATTASRAGGAAGTRFPRGPGGDARHRLMRAAVVDRRLRGVGADRQPARAGIEPRRDGDCDSAFGRRA